MYTSNIKCRKACDKSIECDHLPRENEAFPVFRLFWWGLSYPAHNQCTIFSGRFVIVLLHVFEQGRKGEMHSLVSPIPFLAVSSGTRSI
jgi:hypothetical protein